MSDHLGNKPPKKDQLSCSEKKNSSSSLVPFLYSIGWLGWWFIHGSEVLLAMSIILNCISWSTLRNQELVVLIITWGVPRRTHSRPVYATMEEVEKSIFNLKTRQMFSIHTTQKKSPAIWDMSLRKTRSGKSHDHHFYWKDPISKCVPSPQKRSVGVFRFLRCEETV